MATVKNTYVNTITAAEELDLEKRTIQSWCKTKKIPGAYKMGKEWRIQREQWEQFKRRIMRAS